VLVSRVNGVRRGCEDECVSYSSVSDLVVIGVRMNIKPFVSTDIVGLGMILLGEVVLLSIVVSVLVDEAIRLRNLEVDEVVKVESEFDFEGFLLKRLDVLVGGDSFVEVIPLIAISGEEEGVTILVGLVLEDASSLVVVAVLSAITVESSSGTTAGMAPPAATVFMAVAVEVEV
jgi:hypothetical protein